MEVEIQAGPKTTELATCGWSLVGGNSTQQEGWTQNKGNMMVLLILTNSSHQPSFYSLCQIFGHSSLNHTIRDNHLPNGKTSKILIKTLCPAHFIIPLVWYALHLGWDSGCGCDGMDKWMWLHVLLPLSLLRWLLRDVRPTWGGVYTAYTPTHCALCITQLVCSGLKVLNVQNQQETVTSTQQ